MEIRVENLRKSYGGVNVLENVSLALTPERITCLMAPSGAGKTTLLRILLGLECPDGGMVDRPPGCRWSALFQENRLLEHLDALGNLRFVLGGCFDERTALSLLEELGLGDVGDKSVRDYSGGMKRRLALARCLLAPSDALALDEPFTGLDVENRAKALACIRRFAAGKPTLLVTHDEADAAGLDARIICL